MYLRLLARFVLLSAGFALTTLGILGWKTIDFELDNMWPLAGSFSIHPVYIMVLGMALIPPTLWEIFVLELRREKSRQQNGGAEQ